MSLVVERAALTPRISRRAQEAVVVYLTELQKKQEEKARAAFEAEEKRLREEKRKEREKQAEKGAKK